MPLEAARDEVLEGACPVPRPLVVGVINLAVGVKSHAPRGTHAAAGGDHRTVGFDAQCPASERGFAGERTCEAGEHPKVPVFVKTRPEGVLVVVAADPPLVADRFKPRRLARAGLVLHAKHFVPVGRVQPAVLGREPEDLVLPFGETLVGHTVFGLCRRVGFKLHFFRIPTPRVGRVLGVGGNPHLAPAGAHGDPAVGKELHRTHLQGCPGRGREGGDLVVLGLRGVRRFRPRDGEQGGGGGEGSEENRKEKALRFHGKT